MRALRTAAAALVLGASRATAGTTPAHASGCHWKVVWDTAGVYEQPYRASTVVKLKHSGDIVGPYCNTYTTDDTFVMVACEAAEDGIGWMRQGALRFAY